MVYCRQARAALKRPASMDAAERSVDGAWTNTPDEAATHRSITRAIRDRAESATSWVVCVRHVPRRPV